MDFSENSSAPQPQPIESADDSSRFLLHSKGEINFVIRELIDKGALVTVYFQHNREFILSTLIDINPEKNYLLFDVGGEAHSNERLAASERLMFVASVNGVKVQFVTGRAKMVRYRERDTFIAALPNDLLRLQRREYFRVGIPFSANTSCDIRSSRYGNHTLKLQDISLGGISIIADGPLTGIKLGEKLDDCTLNLGEYGQFQVALEIRRVAPTMQKNGVVQTYLGCQFVNLKPAYQNIIQRYLVHLQREQNALSR